jgi:hypothetical protein
MLKDLPHAKWVAAGKQLILKGDFVDIESAILEVMAIAKQPPNITWVDAATVRVPATADSEAAAVMTGFPNVLHPGQFVSGGLTDGGIRKNSSNVSLIFGVGGAMWGNEKASQWYVIYALAANADTTFTIKAMPFMRVKSQASQVISLGTLVTPATGIGYGFTANELVGGAIYVLSGASQGLLRTISANNNNNTTGGTVTYSGAALSLAAGDWFVVLPPGTNFRWIGSIFNSSGSAIIKFRRLGPMVQWLEEIDIDGPGSWTLSEEVQACCPLATSAQLTVADTTAGAGHPNSDQYTHVTTGTVACALEFCRVYLLSTAAVPVAVSYSYPAGCGY